MAEIIISIAAKLGEYLVDPAIRQGQYLFCPKKIVKNLDKVKKELASVRDHVEKDVKEEKEQTHEIGDVVQEWLDYVTRLMDETTNLEKEMETNITCSWHPNFRRYRLCKQMAKATTIMSELSKDKINVKEFTRPRPIPGIEYYSSGNFTYFESTKVAYDQLLEALKDDSIYMLGLHGMGGSGKTTLAKEVGKMAKESGLFDQVLLVTVSQNPNIRNIQGDMADWLNIQLREESENGRAQRLWLRLKEEKKVLIILDDVWRRLNLEGLGICLDDNYKGSHKVLLTTRLISICTSMSCQKSIPLHLLSEKDAWALFRQRAGLADKPWSNQLHVIERQVASECKGLPIAIEAVGSSLKGRPIEEWRVALDNLCHSKPIEVEEEERDAFSCLELSYNHLKSKEVKLLFLICSMFPEDHKIVIEDLIRYVIGLGVYGEYESFELARSQVRTGINKLVNYYLLSYLDNRKGHLKMHDTVRDVALWIARKGYGTIMVNLEKDLNALAENGAMKDCFILSSWYKETYQISQQLEAPKLEILLLNSRNSLKLSHMAFDGMKMIKVMSLVQEGGRNNTLSFPQSTQLFSNLRTLRLHGWTLGDISFLVSITRLEVLDLRSCSFNKLPDGIEKLNQLKLLDLSFCTIGNSNFEAIGSCSKLEELYAFEFNCHNERPVDVGILTLPKLQRYAIKLGNRSSTRCLELDEDNIYGKGMNVIHLNEFDISSLFASSRNLLQRANEVHLYNLHGGCKSIMPDMVQAVGGMSNLTNLLLEDCSEIECLIDTTSGLASASSFPEDAMSPSFVDLEYMPNLKEVCRGQPSPDFFEKLEVLSIKNCLQIEELFSMSVARSLQQLKNLRISDCNKLKHIITNGREDGTNTVEEIVPTLDNAHLLFPNLKVVSVRSCPKLKVIFPISYVHEEPRQLQMISIIDCEALEYIFGHYDQDVHSSQIKIMLPVVRRFHLRDLKNLLGICPQNNHSSFSSPRALIRTGCPKLNTSWAGVMIDLEQRHPHLDMQKERVMLNITATSSQLSNQVLPEALQSILNLETLHLGQSGVEGIFQLQVEGGLSCNTEPKAFNSNLEDLILFSLPELRFIWNAPAQFLSLTELKDVHLYQCPKLKAILSATVAIYLPKLRRLVIDRCEELEEIMSSNSKDAQEFSDPSAACPRQKMCFPNLCMIKVSQCNKIKHLFSDSMACHFLKVEMLILVECTQLERVFKIESEEDDDQSDGREGGDEERERIVFPQLSYLTLKSLPIFTEICSGYNLDMSQIKDCKVEECPNIRL